MRCRRAKTARKNVPMGFMLSNCLVRHLPRRAARMSARGFIAFGQVFGTPSGSSRFSCRFGKQHHKRLTVSCQLGKCAGIRCRCLKKKTDFLHGVKTITTAGDVYTQVGMASHVYAFNASMEDDHFFNADAELLLVPEVGSLHIFTEMGKFDVAPGEIVVIPRGMVFKVSVEGPSRGYMCENYGAKFTLPDRGPIGANCLANPRDFKTPVAAFEEKDTPCRVIVKWCGNFYETEIPHSPLDVVAWHGNYTPYKYDLATYSPVGSILFDHPDPSIFTVLTAPSGEDGTANIDFVIFPPRWLVAEHTFRPPWYHRNIMSEFMGLIQGQYDAKEEGFVPGGMSLHNMMLPHGPDSGGFYKASNADLKPQKLDNTMAFMFETRFPQLLTDYAAKLETQQDNYIDCWEDLKSHFDGTPEGKWD